MGKKPKGRHKQTKLKRRALKRQQLETAGSQKNTISIVLKNVLQLGSALAMILGILVGALSLLPKVHVSSSASLNPNNPFLTPFVIRNEGHLSIKDVRYYCTIYALRYPKNLIIKGEGKNTRITDESMAAP